MGGAQKVDVGSFIQPPDNRPTEALLQMQSAAMRPLMASQNDILSYAANLPIQSWTPDIYGKDTGALDVASQLSAINSFRSADLESKTNPSAQAMRQALPKMLNEDLQGNGLQKQMDDWTSRHGIARLLGSGMQDSTIGKSALFDAATQEGAALRRANEQAAAAYLQANQAPQAGIDAGAAINALQGAAAQGNQQRAARLQGLVPALQANAQGTTNVINQLMNSTAQATNASQQNWQNYQQAMLNNATQNAASKNAATAGSVGAAGTAVGVAVAAAL